MKNTDSPTLFGTAFGSSAATADITSPLPDTTTTSGRASLAAGFPPENFTPTAAGGVPPYGADWNGILNMLSLAIQALQARGISEWDSTFSEDISGYPQYAVVQYSGEYYVSTADANTTTPGADGATWQSLFSGYALQSWVSGNYVNGLSSGGNAAVQNIQIANYASGFGGISTYLQVAPPNAAAFAIPSVGYGNNVWQAKGNYVASTGTTSGASGDLQISGAYYSTSAGAPYLSGYGSDGKITSYILATQSWTNGTYVAGTTGYEVKPNGKIEQWGTYVTDSTGLLTVNFPIEFPNACDNIEVCEANALGTWVNNSPTLHGVSEAPGKSNFGVVTRLWNADTSKWQAGGAAGYFKATGH